MADNDRPRRTPMYEAMNAQRYQRQTLIRSIQARAGTPFISYIAGPGAEISREDTIYFNDLLHNLTSPTNLDFMLHTPGGDIDAAEKLMVAIRGRVGGAWLRVIVPDFAKSAGTLIAIGADEILMGDTSELGPIDPQATATDSDGNCVRHPVQAYLQAYKSLETRLKKDPNDVAAQTMLSKLDPTMVVLFESIRARAQKFAEKQLKDGMCRHGGAYTAIAEQLIDPERWPTHGQVIDWEDANAMGIKATHLSPVDERWKEYWRLYCLQRHAVRDGEKLFESEYASVMSRPGC
jgi:hypothetical protein